jgi:Peptidase family M28
MRKLWIWLVLLVATAALLVAWRWAPLPTLLSSLDRIGLDRTSAPTHLADPASLVLPAVDSQRLLSDLDTLTFRRYDEAERQRARDYLQQALEQAGWTVQLQPFSGGINLIAERAGTDPSLSKILLGAHYDTVEDSPGADDNATSVATVLEAARLLGPTPTPRTLQLALFDLEEQGLLGSRAFVEQSADKATLVGAIILDMLGYACTQPGCQSYPPLPIRPPSDRGDFLAAIGDQGHPQLLNSLVNQTDLPSVYTLAVPTFGKIGSDLIRSDHAPFWEAGIGAVLITDTANFRNPHYHQPSDTLETIDSTFFVGSAQMVINAVARLLQS